MREMSFCGESRYEGAVTRLGNEFTRLKKKMTTDLKNDVMQQLHCHTILNKVIEE